MTEFHQFKKPHDQSHELSPNPQEPTMDTIAQSSSQIDSPSEATVEVNTEGTASQIYKAPYETIQQGPITYFRYYYEDAEQPTYRTSGVAELFPKRNLLPLYLAGSGVLGATLISGAVIAGLANNSKSQPPQNVTQPEVKQTPSSTKTRPQVAPPELMPQSRSTPAKPSQKPKKAFTQKSSTATPAQSSSKLLLQQALAVPDSIPVSNLPTFSVPITRSIPKPLPFPPGQSSQPTSPTQESLPANLPLQNSPPSSTQALAVPDSIPVSNLPTFSVPITRSIPKPLPFPPGQSSQPTSPTQESLPANLPLQNSPPSSTRANGSSTPTPPIVPSVPKSATPSQSTADARCVSPVSDAATDSRSTLFQASMLVSAPEKVEVAAVNSKAQIEKSMLVKAAQTIAAQDPSLSDAEKELQAFLELPQSFPTSAGIAILPLPCQIARTAVAKKQVGEFTVLRLSPQDYQKSWETSSKNPQAMVPIYGFVNYVQHAIVLVVQRI
ncbi:hypothetical protein [Phormidesmis priestleyi]|uniref:hypothetical protein n=1 Tax=Phormidesmis priestleyi TaxID=268141 RepID=UPI00083B5D32|nr:hypothetical protein [Phormidesmis priestleyi]